MTPEPRPAAASTRPHRGKPSTCKRCYRSLVLHDGGQITLGFVLHVADFRRVESTALRQLGVQVVVGQTAQPKLVLPHLTVLRRAHAPGDRQACQAPDGTASRLASRCTTIKVTRATALVRYD